MFHVPLTLGFSIGKPININSVSMPFTTRATSTLYSEPSAGAEIGTGLSEPDSDSSVASKFFQLEEKEDKDSCTTELFLAKDGTVTLAETDGPLPVRATGVWSQQGNEFRMKIKRTFNGGQPGRDVGEFLFDVERGFTGFLEIVGGLTCVDGSMHILVSSLFDDQLTHWKFGSDVHNIMTLSISFAVKLTFGSCVTLCLSILLQYRMQIEGIWK